MTEVDEVESAGRSMQSAETSEATRSDAARLLGSASTEKKRASSRDNGLKGGGPVKPLSYYPCTCGKGNATEGHPTTCRRGRAIRRRLKAGKPLE